MRLKRHGLMATFLAKYSLHVWLLLILANFSLAYFMQIGSKAAGEGAEFTNVVSSQTVVRMDVDMKKWWGLMGSLLLVVFVVVNYLIWRLFHKPKPKVAKIDITKLEEGKKIVGHYYITPQNKVEGGWWITLSDGVAKVWGYMQGEYVPQAWAKVTAVQQKSGGVPFLRIIDLELN